MRNNYSSLMDGGQITAPRFALFNPRTGQFDVENIGVAPDIEVDLDPAAWRQGHDPQLEKGVSAALTELKEHPVPPIKRPNYRSTLRRSALRPPRAKQVPPPAAVVAAKDNPGL